MEFSLSFLQVYAVSNMISSSADALSHPALKFFNDTFSHPPCNIGYEVFDCFLSSITFCELFWYSLSLQYPRRMRSGEHGDHEKALFLEITFPPNNSSRCLIVAVVVWGGALLFRNHWLPNNRSWRRGNNQWKVSITPKAHHAVHLSLWRGRSLSSFATYLPHILPF